LEKTIQHADKSEITLKKRTSRSFYIKIKPQKNVELDQMLNLKKKAYTATVVEQKTT